MDDDARLTWVCRLLAAQAADSVRARAAGGERDRAQEWRSVVNHRVGWSERELLERLVAAGLVRTVEGDVRVGVSFKGSDIVRGPVYDGLTTAGVRRGL